jgi:hypothetical protein
MTGTYPAGVQTTAQISPAPTAPVKKKKPVALIVGVLAFAVILGVAVAVLLIFMNGGGRPQSPQETLDRIIDTALDGDYEKAIDCIYEYRYSDELRQQALDFMSEMSGFNLKSLGVDKEAVKALVTFKVRGTQEASPRIAESIREKLSDSGVPTDPINKILKSDVMVTLVGNSQSAELYFAETDDGCYLISSEGSMDGIVPQPEDYLK